MTIFRNPFFLSFPFPALGIQLTCRRPNKTVEHVSNLALEPNMRHPQPQASGGFFFC